MDIVDIRQLIANDEHLRLELKKTTGELKDAMHTACALLNTGGGWLVFGIAPVSLTVVGQKVTDNTQKDLAQALAGLEPAVDVQVEYIDLPNCPENKVIAIHFDAFVWGRQPYTYKGCPYYKIESTTKTMPRTMFEERLRAARPQYYSWEIQKAESVTVSQLNEQRIRGSISLGIKGGRLHETAMTEPLEIILGKLRLLNDGTPNNAAVALFGNNISEYPQFRLRMARFLGNDKNQFIDNQRAEGNIFDLLDAGMAFFFKHLSLSGNIVGLQREEHLEIPREALREALVNALCHRQYEKYNLTTGIAIYDDHIEIENPGIFPPQLSPQKIKRSHISYPYNPIIADILFKTTLLENWGSGATRIISACKKQNISEPEWKIQDGFVIVTFQRPLLRQKKASPLFSNLPGTCMELAQNLPRQVKELVEAINTLSLTKKEILGSKKISCKSRETLEHKFLAPAIKKGLVAMIYPESPKHPKQEYKLTEIGLELLRTLHTPTPPPPSN